MRVGRFASTLEQKEELEPVVPHKPEYFAVPSPEKHAENRAFRIKKASDDCRWLSAFDPEKRLVLTGCGCSVRAPTLL